MVQSTPTADSFVLITNGLVTLGSATFTAGATYFLSETAGALTTTVPTTTGAINKPVLLAISTTTGLVVAQQRGVEITNQTSQIAQTYWVDKTGSDVTGDGSLLTPYATVQAAHDAALTAYPISGSGTVWVQINVAPGLYSGNTTITRQRTIINGTAGLPNTTGVSLQGAFVVDTSTAISKFIDPYTVQGIRFGQTGSASAPAFQVIGSGPALVLANFCYFEASSSNSACNGIHVNTTAASKVRVEVRSSVVSSTNAADAVYMQAGGEFWTNNCTVQTTAAGAGYALRLAGNCTALNGLTSFDSSARVGTVKIETTAGSSYLAPNLPIIMSNCGIVAGSSGAVDSGTATAGSTTTLTDSSKTWTTNQYAGYTVAITSGTGLGQYRTIASNTGTALTIQGTWTTPPAAGSVYSIRTATGGSGVIVSTTNTAVLTSYMTWTISGPSTTGVRSVQAQAVENGSVTTLATTSTLIDSSKTWTTNQYAGYVVVPTTGTLAGQARAIASNTSTTITLGAAPPAFTVTTWTSALAVGTGYIIIPFVYWTQAQNVYFPDSNAITGNTSYTSGIVFGTFATTPASAN